MNNSEITFGQVRSLCYSKDKNNGQHFVDYLNTFEGNDIYEKFKNILTIWSHDVSPTLDLSLEKPIQLRLEYLLSEFGETLGDPIHIANNGFTCLVDVPKYFTESVDMFPVYEILQEIDIFDIKINLSDLSTFDKHKIVDNLPPNIYNDMLKFVMEDRSKILKFSNPVLKDLKLNFLTNDPYAFLQGLFARYNKDYFRDVIYALSKKVDGNILMNSTISDVEYYVQKFNEEVHEQEKSQNSGQQRSSM